MTSLFGVLRRVMRVRKVRKNKKRVRRPSVAPLERAQARALVHARLEHFNQLYGFTYYKVFIKNTKTRWGSCSSKGNLNFSYRIIHLAPEVQDYIIVHELCHLEEFNHQKPFWDLVARAVPEHQRIRALLRETMLS